MFLALGMQRAMRMRRIVACILSTCTTFSKLCHKRARFWKKNLPKVNCVLHFLYNFFLKHFSV